MSSYIPQVVVDLKLLLDPEMRPVRREPLPRNPCEVASAATMTTPLAVDPAVLRSDGVSYVLGRIPSQARVELPGYRQAGTFDLTFRFDDLPLDARVVRAAAVEVHVGAVLAENYARGVRGERVNGRLASVLQTRTPQGPNLSTLALAGVVDTWKTTHDDRGSSVTIHGRDLRAILIDSPMCPGAFERVDLTLPIDQCVASIVSMHPFGAQINVIADPSEWAGTVPAPAVAELAPRAARGARGTRRPRMPFGRNPSQISYWDAITRLCYLVGAIPFFAGLKLQVRPARSIFQQVRAGTALGGETPFAGGRQRTGSSGAPFSVRRMVFGRDIKSVTFNREMGGNAKPKVVRAVAVDLARVAESGGEPAPLLEARWPPALPPSPAPSSPDATGAAPSGDTQTEVLNIPVSGVRTIEQLTEIARGIFEEVGRNELTGSCQTKNLASFAGDNADADLLRLRPGDGVEFLADVSRAGLRRESVSTYTDDQRAPAEQRIAELAARLGDATLARAIVLSARAAPERLPRFFRVSTVGFDWTINGGINISFDFQNYVVARFAALQEAAAASAAPTATPAPERLP